MRALTSGDTFVGVLSEPSSSFFSSGNLILSSPLSILRSSSTWFCARNGGFPTLISNSTAPTLHRSAFASYFSYRKISGAMYRLQKRTTRSARETAQESGEQGYLRRSTKCFSHTLRRKPSCETEICDLENWDSRRMSSSEVFCRSGLKEEVLRTTRNCQSSCIDDEKEEGVYLRFDIAVNNVLCSKKPQSVD